MRKEDLSEKREYFVIKPEITSQLDIEQVFGNSNPVHLEIGCGRGEFIAQKAKQRRDLNFLGLEVKEKRIKSVLRKLEIEQDSNVRLMRVFVDKSINKIFTSDSFDQIYILHPDPWPKRKHHKNRLIQKEFVDNLYYLLKPEGIIDISTDHKEYADWIEIVFKEKLRFKSLYPETISMFPPPGHITTHFEQKKSGEGYRPLYLRYQKVT